MVDELPDVRGRVFAAGVLLAVGDDHEHDVLRAEVRRRVLLGAGDLPDRLADRVQQRGGASHAIVSLGHGAHRADVHAVVQQLVAAVEKHRRDQALPALLPLLGEHRVEAADRVTLQAGHRPAFVEDEHQLRQALLCHLAASFGLLPYRTRPRMPHGGAAWVAFKATSAGWGEGAVPAARARRGREAACLRAPTSSRAAVGRRRRGPRLSRRCRSGR